jgi:predicted MPP superfamily phosphohydrolase
MADIRATIMHISDLHFGSKINASLLPRLKEIVKEVRPDFLIVSGDLAENPSPRTMRRACKYINDLADACDKLKDHILIIPGNHDYKIKGNFGLGRLTRIPFEVYFRRGGLEMKFWERWLTYSELTLKAFLGTALEDKLIKQVDERCGIALFGFNSTPLFELFGFATGRVEADQILQLAIELEDNKDQWEKLFKIAVVHHHPVPIPYVSTALAERVQESFMVFYNAGTFLREMGRSGIDLVLHGHKHYSGFTRVTYDSADGERSQIGVLAAGSTTHRSPSDRLGNEFNIIEVFDDGTANIHQWYFAADVRRKDESRTYSLYGFDDIKERNKRRAIRQRGLTVGRKSKTVQVTYHGYSGVEVSLERCRVCNKNGLSAYGLDLSVNRPAYIREPAATKLPDSPRLLKLKVDQLESHLRRLKCSIAFGETLKATDGLFDFGYSYQLMSGHALSYSEFQRKYAGQNLDSEYASIECTEVTDSLMLTVFFPEADILSAADYDAEVVYIPQTGQASDEERQHYEETSRVRGTVVPGPKSLRLDVVSPVPGLIYRIRWDYRKVSQPDLRASRAREGLLEYVRRELISNAEAEASRAGPSVAYRYIVKLLGAFLNDVKESYPEIDAQEQLDISLLVFDDAKSALRFVASNRKPIAELFEETFMPGEGCAGYSFERNRVLFYDHAIAGSRYWYITPEEVSKERNASTSLFEQNVLLSIPWADEHTGVVMGVICIGSGSKYSRLLHIFDLSSGEQQSEKDRLLSLTMLLGEAIIALAKSDRLKGGESDGSESNE